MRLKKSTIITRIIVFALIAFAVVSILNAQSQISEATEVQRAIRRAVAEKELSNAELEYDLENIDDPDVIANIARANLGLVLPGEIILFDSSAPRAGG